MSTLLTNVNFYLLGILPPAALLWVCGISFPSLWKVSALSLTLQLLLYILIDSALAPRPTAGFGSATARLSPTLLLEVLGWAVVDPLICVVFFSWALQQPRVTKALGIIAAIENNNNNNNGAGSWEQQQAQLAQEWWPLRLPQQAMWYCTRQLATPRIAPLFAVAVPWGFSHFVLYYWSSWYEKMSTLGDVSRVWSGMYETFFYFAAALSIARRIGVHESLHVDEEEAGNYTVTSPTTRNSDNNAHAHNKHTSNAVNNNSNSFTISGAILVRMLVIFCCTLAIVGASSVGAGEVTDRTTRTGLVPSSVNIPLVVSILWSVS